MPDHRWSRGERNVLRGVAKRCSHLADAEVARAMVSEGKLNRSENAIRRKLHHERKREAERRARARAEDPLFVLAEVASLVAPAEACDLAELKYRVGVLSRLALAEDDRIRALEKEGSRREPLLTKRE